MALAASAQISEVTKVKGDGFDFIPKSLTTTGVITPYSTIGVVLLAAIVFIADGSLGILKISLKRFLHIWILKNTLTPLHDHVRKRKGWSDEQVVARWLILQCVASALLLLLVRG